MQALHDLIQGLAKEEKRLYNLHGRDGRFRDIYKAYAQHEEFSKELDRDIYQKHFSSFSKAFYSMQKGALMDDIVAVLLEYSNSAHDTFNCIRLNSKYQVLVYKGFPDAALSYQKSALEAARKVARPRQILRLLEDYRDTLASSAESDWSDYQAVLAEIEEVKSMADRFLPLELAEQRLSVVIATASRASDKEKYAEEAWQAVAEIQVLASEIGAEESLETAFKAELRYAQHFETKLQLHKRLIVQEKASQKEGTPRGLRMHIVTELMQSCMDCGDFLLINGLIYRCNKDLQLLNEQQKAHFLPAYLELCSLYHYYENELSTAQKEVSELITFPSLSEEDLLRHHSTKVAYWIAANMPRNATEAIEQLFTLFPDSRSNLEAKLMELMIAVEANRRDEAIVLLQKMRILVRKAPDGRKLGHYRQFLELLHRHLTKKKVAWQEIAGLKFPWTQPLKPNLWLKAKIENKFYYNYVLEDWQGRKKILNL